VGLAGLVAAPQAVRWLGAVTQTLSVIGAQHVIVTDTEYAQNLEHARSNLDEATFAAAWAEGCDLPLEQATLECSGSITATDAQMWINDLKEADRDGRFFCAVTAFTVVGQKRLSIQG